MRLENILTLVNVCLQRIAGSMVALEFGGEHGEVHEVSVDNDLIRFEIM
jgi:hypothetical protein